MTDPTARPALWMLLCAFAFAAMGTLTSALGSRCDWLVIALVRALFMFATAVLMARSAGVRLVFWRPGTLWVRSLAGSFSLVCNFFAMTRLPVSEVLTLTNAYPLWIVALSAVVLRQFPTFSELLGVASGLVGVVLIQRPSLVANDIAAFVAIVGSVSAAVAMLGLHRLKEVDTRAVLAHFSGVASVVAGTWFLLGGRKFVPGHVDPITVLMLLGVGTTGTIGQYFLTKAYAAGVPTKVAVIGLTQVLFGMAFDAVIWGRSMTPLGLLGSGLVLAPTAWLTTRSIVGAEPSAISTAEVDPGL